MPVPAHSAAAAAAGNPSPLSPPPFVLAVLKSLVSLRPLNHHSPHRPLCYLLTFRAYTGYRLPRAKRAAVRT
eukprot:scaffold818_cov64-Phaeocystis_antarctica.AAC.5